MSALSKPSSAPPRLAVRAVLGLRRALLRAADALTPAPVVVFEKATGVAAGIVVGEIARLGVPDRLEARAMTSDEIAAELGLDPDATARVMRAAAYMGLFTRDAGGRFSNTRLARALTTGEPMTARWFAAYFATKSNLHAWADFGETWKTGKNAFERVHGASVWDWFDRHPEERETFARAMSVMTMNDAPGVAESYPFDEIGTLCDVGGGRGTLLSELLLHHPRLRGILCDGEGVLASAKAFLRERGVADRVELVAGSFFESVPEGADAYILKSVLHDWDDARSIRILANVRRAAKTGAKVLLVEMIVEPDGDDFGALADLQMMTVCGEGRERGRADFERLFAASGFRLGRVVEAPTPCYVIEGVAV